MFCGIRSSELQKLTWREVRIDEGFVTIPPKIAKKRRIRNIPLEANALVWLHKFGIQDSGPIAPTGQTGVSKRLKKLRHYASALAARLGGVAGAGGVEFFSPIPEWPDNAMRHSFASYFYAWTGNAQETCARLGQKSDDVMFEHYRALTRREEGAAYFSLLPRTDDTLLMLLAPTTENTRSQTAA